MGGCGEGGGQHWQVITLVTLTTIVFVVRDSNICIYYSVHLLYEQIELFLLFLYGFSFLLQNGQEEIIPYIMDSKEQLSLF